MLEKLQARRDLLVKEHTSLVEQHNALNKSLKETEQRISMLVGHVGEIDYQIKAIDMDADDASKEG